MRKRLIDDIEIIEPPIEEITKKKGGFKKGCLIILIFLIVAFVILMVSIKVAMGPGPQNLSSLPENFPKDIPVYDQKNVDNITFISGRYKNRGVEIAAIFPKIILSPLFLTLDDNAKPANREAEKKNYLKDFWRVITMPVGDARDTVRIEWLNVETRQDYLMHYYQNELTKSKYVIDMESSGHGVKQFTFSGQNGITGSFYTNDSNQNKVGTETAILTINLPPQIEK